MCVCVCVTESFCCIEVINKTVYVNYTPIKIFKIENKMLPAEWGTFALNTLSRLCPLSAPLQRQKGSDSLCWNFSLPSR